MIGLLLVVTMFAVGEDTLAAARELYASAAYEDALAVLNKLPDTNRPDETRVVEQYRALCLLALGRTGEAERAIEAVVNGDPSYRPASDVSPRVRPPPSAMSAGGCCRPSFSRSTPREGRVRPQGVCDGGDRVHADARSDDRSGRPGSREPATVVRSANAGLRLPRFGDDRGHGRAAAAAACSRTASTAAAAPAGAACLLQLRGRECDPSGDCSPGSSAISRPDPRR